MHKVFLSLILLFSNVLPAMAWSPEFFPSDFHIKEQQGQGRSFYLTAQDTPVGSLMPKMNRKGTWEFFDENNQLQVIFKYTGRFFFSPKFDIFDKNHVLVGKLLENFEHKSGRFLGFFIYAPDGKTVLVNCAADLFGTKHTIYAGSHWKEVLADLSRPLFTWSRDSDVRMLDKGKISSILNPNVLVAVIAFYCDHDFTVGIDSPDEVSEPPKSIQNLQAKLKKLEQSLGLPEDAPAVSEERLKAAADMLNQRYQEVFDDSYLNEEEKVKQFVNFGCGLIQSHAFSLEEEQAMLQFMLSRLKG